MTEAFIRKERALAKGYSVAQSRGHPRVKKGEPSVMLAKDLSNFTNLSQKRQDMLYNLMKKHAKTSGKRLSIFWTSVVSPTYKVAA